MRGRKGDPATQAAKGNPGKRRNKVERMLDEARVRAEGLATATATAADILSPPAFLDERFGAALVVWREFAPRLHRLRNFQDIDRLAFAQLCVSYDMWLTATQRVQERGPVSLVKTVSGDKMERLSPYVSIQSIAFRQCQDLFEAFGMTPIDRAKLFRDRQALPAGLWSTGSGDEPAPRPDNSNASRSSSPIGSMDLLDSDAPGLSVN